MNYGISAQINIPLGKAPALCHEADLSSYADLEVFIDFNEREKVLPTKVRLKTANYELIILNKTIYE